MAARENAHPDEIPVGRMYYASALLSGAMLLGLIAATVLSLRFGYADWEFRKQTAEGVARAVELVPRNTSYLEQSALQTEYAGGDATPTWKRIAELNPTSSVPLLRLGLEAEQRGDTVEAERFMQAAYNVDRQFETRWTLANFYLRQQRMDDFWLWLRRALEIEVADRKPVFDLAWRVGSGPDEILARGIPDDAGSLAAYLSYVLSAEHVEAALPVEQKLMLVGSAKEHRDLLRWTCDVLVNAGRGGEAAEVWRSLGYPAAVGVTNPNFNEDFGSVGFDWKYESSPGVTHSQLETGGHRIRMSGQQAESVELLQETLVGLVPGQRYQLRWQSQATGLATRGIRWVVDGVGGDGEVMLREGASEGSWAFQAPRAFATLRLRYSRQTGETRAMGLFDLLSVKLVQATK